MPLPPGGYTPQPSSERLAEELDRAGLTELAQRARRDEFHDFKTPHAMPQHVLVAELRKVAMDKRAQHRRDSAEGLARRVIEGDFDATAAEGDEWAASPEGQAAYAELLNRGRG